MPVDFRPQVVLNEVATKMSTSDWTHDTIQVTWTATMTDGSLLTDTNTEVANAAAAATATKVIDDPSNTRGNTVGDTVALNVAVQGNVFNTTALQYADAAVPDPAVLTGLTAKLNTFETITSTPA